MQIRSSSFNPRAFSLIELLTIIAIISIVAAFSVPAYLNNIKTTKINSLWPLTQPAKDYLSQRYLKENIDPTTITLNSSGSPTAIVGNWVGSNVRCITIQNGIITALLADTALNISDIWVSWTPTVSNGEINWACNYSTAAAEFIASSTPNCTVGTEHYSTDSGCTI